MLKEDMEVMGPVRMKDVGLAQQELWRWRVSWRARAG